MKIGEYERVTDTHVYFLKGPLSQWWPSEFVTQSTVASMVGRTDGTTFKYANCEQYMMHNKAMIMGDFETSVKILAEKSPKIVKELGRKVRGFDQEMWDRICTYVVIEGNCSKFYQDRRLLEYLISTGNKTLVEASPYDNIWGVGISQESDRILDEKNWTGRNYLGKSLMVVRDSYDTDRYKEGKANAIKELKEWHQNKKRV
jgi:hypothetical protein